jgi:hypothetical protein
MNLFLTPELLDTATAYGAGGILALLLAALLAVGFLK